MSSAPRLVPLLIAACLGWNYPAAAQDPYGPGITPGFGSGAGPGAAGPRGGGKKGKKPPPPAPVEGEPEFHAASGGDTMIPEGEEPTLPRQPLRVSDAVRERIGSSFDPEMNEPPRVGQPRRLVIPPYFSERQGAYRLKTVFPLWVDRQRPSTSAPERTDRASLYGGLYYRRRSAEHRHDILFPLFWNLAEADGERTTVAGPFVNRRAEGQSDDWLLPLYATGRRPGGGYTLVPPLLTYTQRQLDRGLRIVGPGYCRWQGGPQCDARTAEELSFGIAPFYFFRQTPLTKLEAIPPLLHYYRFDDRAESYTNVWGPYFRRHQMRSEGGERHDWEALHLLPFYFSLWGPGERHTTVAPLFHYGYDRDEKSWLFVNPLFVAARGKEADRTFVTWLYGRYRGRTRLDMVTPLYWQFEDPDVGVESRLVFPFYYAKTSPRETTRALFPFYARSHRFGLSESTWVTPFVQHRTGLRGWETNVHPLVYLGRNGHRSHAIIAPFYWDFAGRTNRTTVGFPLYWRFSSPDSLSQLVGNVYYRERSGTLGTHWQFHLFPLFSYASRPDGHAWNLLYGLAGYTRRGDLIRARALWIPITLNKSVDAELNPQR